MASSPRLLWAGLGNMGMGMCKNLVEKTQLDSPLLVWNRSVERSTLLSSKLGTGKTQVVESITSGVEAADIIFICVANDEAVQDTVTAMLQVDVKGKLFIDCSTIHPETTEALEKSIIAKGGEFVAAPVFGAPAAAEAGMLVGVLAGPGASVTRAKPYFVGVMARAQLDLSGKACREASMLKILGNTFILNMVEQVAEGHVMAEKSGLGSETLHHFLEAMFPGVYTAYSTRMTSGDYYKRERPLFPVDLALKDARHAKSLAAAAGVHMRNLETADEHLKQLKEHAGAGGDIAGIYGAVRKENGLKFEN